MTEPTPEEQAALEAAALAPRPLGGKWDIDSVQPPMPGLPAMVVVQITDPSGIAVRFLDPETALVIAEMLRQKAREAKGSRLIVPPGLSNGFGGVL